MPFVLDASMAVAWAFEEEGSAYPNRVLDMLVTERASVPSIWPLEVGNALLTAERKQRIEAAESARFIALIESLPVEMHDLPSDRALGAVLELGRQQGLTTYDASYLELAIREGLPLATLDDRLQSAARHLGVPLVE